MSAVLRSLQFRHRLSWLLLALVISWSVAQGALLDFPAGAPGAGAANLLFLLGAWLSLAAHELVQHLAGAPEGETEPKAAAWAELRAAACGPFVHLVAALALLAFTRAAFAAGLAEPSVRALAAVITLNVVMAAANLVPAPPLDGGRILRAALALGVRDELRAAGVVRAVGEVVALLILSLGVATAALGDLADALMWILGGVVLLGEGRPPGLALTQLQAESPDAAGETGLTKRAGLR